MNIKGKVMSYMFFHDYVNCDLIIINFSSNNKVSPFLITF